MFQRGYSVGQIIHRGIRLRRSGGVRSSTNYDCPGLIAAAIVSLCIQWAEGKSRKVPSLRQSKSSLPNMYSLAKNRGGDQKRPYVRTYGGTADALEASSRRSTRHGGSEVLFVKVCMPVDFRRVRLSVCMIE